MLKSTSSFEKLIEKATSHLLLDPDWSTIIAICDMIRQNDVQASQAVLAVKKRLIHQNPHVVLLALNVLEAMVKNCGGPVHDEVGNHQFMQEMYALATRSSDMVREKLLQMLLTWAHAFRNSPRYSSVQDTVKLMRAEGFKFPALRVSDAMFAVEMAPAWLDGDVCHRCRASFTTFNRKHHCRACGQVFCSKCSSKMSNIPKLGIEREVRVCDPCFDQINKVGAPASAPSIQSHPVSSSESDLPPEYLASPLSKQSQAPPSKSETELKEQEELNLALAISQSEAEAKERERGKTARRQIVASYSAESESPPARKSALKKSSIERDPAADPELARYLDRSYWQAKQQQQQEEEVVETDGVSEPASQQADDWSANGDISADYPANTAVSATSTDQEIDAFVPNICSQLEIFVNRMKSNSSRGRSISNDTSVQSMFINITSLHTQLLKYLQAQEDRRVHYEWLQDRLSQVRDARAALDSLREEHREQQRRQAEEAQRRRQIQMMQKLEIMRQKKHEYLQYQRQMAMQRIQDQELEMARRYEQQQQQVVFQQPQQQFMWPQQQQQCIPYQPAWQPQLQPGQQPQLQPGQQPQLQPGQPQLQPEPPQIQPGQPQIQPGQPHLQPGQPQLQPGQPQLQPGQPQLQPGQPQLQPGQPPQLHPGQPPQLHPQLQPLQPQFYQGHQQMYQPQPQLVQSQLQAMSQSQQQQQSHLAHHQPQEQQILPGYMSGVPMVQGAEPASVDMTASTADAFNMSSMTNSLPSSNYGGAVSIAAGSMVGPAPAQYAAPPGTMPAPCVNPGYSATQAPSVGQNPPSVPGGEVSVAPLISFD